MTRVGQQNGYILLPVVLFITVIATIAFLINNDTTINGNMTAAAVEAEKAQQVAQAGLAQAVWGAQNSGCAGDMSMTTVPFGQAGTDSYTATVTTPGGATTAYSLSADQDAWFRSDNITNNNGGAVSHHLRMETGNLEYAVVRFDLSTLPAGAQINSATARFYIKATKGHPEGPVNVHRVTADWTEAGATWETMATNFDSVTLNTIPAQPAAGDNWVQVNLTAQLQAWVNGGESNYGIMLIPTGEGTHAEYISREGAASQQPRLELVVGTGPASPATIQVTGTLPPDPLGNSISRTLTRDDVAVHQPASDSFLQLQAGSGKDTLVDGFYNSRNHGDYELKVSSDPSWLMNTLVQFDLATIPTGVRVLSAQLQLYHTGTTTAGADAGATVHRVARDWVEGTKSGVGVADGATWDTWDGTSAWATAGGDYDSAPVAGSAITAATGDWESWDIKTLVQGWLDGTFANNGLLLKGSGNVNVKLASKEDADPTLHPKLTIKYACECGNPCLAPQGAGNILMVVGDDNPLAITPGDAKKKALFELWGYTVNLQNDNTSAAGMLSQVASNDVVYVSESVVASTLGEKLTGVSIGIINENGGLNDELGIATGSVWPVGSSISVIDNSHYITAPFPAGPLVIDSAAMEGLTVSGSEAPGLQTLADWGGAGSLVLLETGAALGGSHTGENAAGRRVMLPLGREGNFNWDYLNNNGRLTVQRALQWGIGATGPAPPKNLLFVSASLSPTAQEQLRVDLIEAWGYSVNLIADDDTQANFDTAVAANDVAYVPTTIDATALGTKLTAATIGVVIEEWTNDFGIATDFTVRSRDEIDIIDNTHYITSPYSMGLLTYLSSLQPVTNINSGLAPDLITLGMVFNTGSQWKPGLAVIDAGGSLAGGGIAAGRRVQLPWGDVSFDINALNAAGKDIMKRSIEWAEVAGAPPPSVYNVLLVVGNLTLSSKDVGYKALMESWGHTVALIDDGDSQANYDTAMAAADVVYASGSALGANMLDKATNTTKGLVNEVVGKIDNFGFSSSTSSTVNTDTFSKTDALHYITESFSGNPVTVFTSSLTNPVPGGTLAPDLSNVGEVSGTLALVTLDIGATRYDGNPSQGRRAHLPFASAETTNLTADGKTILQRALEWAAGAGAGGSGSGSGSGGGPTGVVFEEFTDASLGSNGKALTLSKPGGTATGDLLIAAVATDGKQGTWTPPSAGWTLIDAGTQSEEVALAVWWKLAGSSEPASYNFSWAEDQEAYGWMMRFTGHDPVNPIDVSASSGGSSSSPTSPAVTTSVADALILRIGGFDDDDISVGAPGLAGHAAITMDKSGAGNATCSSGAGYLKQTAAGDSGTSSFSLNGSEQYRTVTIGIAPAP